jgi:hypothetical protein
MRLAMTTKHTPASKATAPTRGPTPGEPGGKCDKCLYPEACKRIDYCVGYKRKFGKWERL